MRKRLAYVLCMVLLLLSTQNMPAFAGDDPSANPFESMDQAREKALSNMKAAEDKDPGPSVQQQRIQQARQADTPRQTRSILRFKDDVPLQDIYEGIKEYPFTILGDSSMRTFAVESDDIDAMKSTFGDKLLSAEEDSRIKVDSITSDEFADDQWALPAIKIPEAWATTKGSDTVYVAVIDSGVDRSHEDLLSSDIRQGADFVYGGACDWDSMGHGTSVTGIVAATPDNGLGIAGVCWDVAIVPYLVVDYDGYATVADTCSAIYAAADIGCDVINLSLGSTYPSAAEENAIAYAITQGCIVVAAAGNDGSTAKEYPASYPGVVSVTSIDSDLNVSGFSQKNDAVDVAAPGQHVATLWDPEYNEGHEYGFEDGTSFAAPYVCGIAALVRSIDKTVDSNQFHDLLFKTSTDKGPAGYDNSYGCGVINAQALMDYFTKSGNANLAGITVSGGVLSPTFQPDVTDYTMTLDSDAPTFTVAASVQEPFSKVSINGIPGARASLPAYGVDFSISIDVLAGNGVSHKIYTISVHPYAVGISAYIPAGFLMRNQSCVNDNIIIQVDPAVVTSPYALLDGNNIPWPVDNTFTQEGKYTIIASRTDGGTSQFYFTIDKTAPVISTKSASGVVIPYGSIAYGDVYVTITEINVNSVVVKRNGVPIEWPADGKFSPLGRGDNTATTYEVIVTDSAQLRTSFFMFVLSDVYILHFDSRGGSEVADIETPIGSKVTSPVTMRPGYTFTGWYIDSTLYCRWNPDTNTLLNGWTLYAGWMTQTPHLLNGITLSTGVLNRPFDAKITSYTVNLGENDPSVTITPIKAYGGAILTINRKPVSSKTITLANGKTTTVTVMVYWGKKTFYKLTIKRAKSTVNTLGALNASAGTWSQPFDPSVANYTLTLPENVGKVTLSAARASGLATVSPAKGSFTLKNGQMVRATFKVKAQSGATRTYTVFITRARSTNANLASLKLNVKGMAPGFSPTGTDYAITLPAKTASVTIAAKAADKLSTVRINGAKKASLAVKLANGQTATVTVTVTAQSGDVKSYTITVSRQ